MKDRTAFSRQVIATGTHEDMVAFEQTLLEAVDAVKDPQFYNKHNQNGLLPYTGGSKKGQWVGKKNPMYGKTHTDSTKQLMSENRKGKGKQPKSPEHREKIRLAALKRWERHRGD